MVQDYEFQLFCLLWWWRGVHAESKPVAFQRASGILVDWSISCALCITISFRPTNHILQMGAGSSFEAFRSSSQKQWSRPHLNWDHFSVSFFFYVLTKRCEVSDLFIPVNAEHLLFEVNPFPLLWSCLGFKDLPLSTAYLGIWDKFLLQSWLRVLWVPFRPKAGLVSLSISLAAAVCEQNAVFPVWVKSWFQQGQVTNIT